MSTQVHIPAWLRPRLEERNWLKVLRPRGNTIMGVSGGRSSGMLWCLAVLAAREGGWEPPRASFQNTGEEDVKTIRFIANLREVHLFPMLEYRPPPAIGAAPKESQFVEVTPDTCSMKGEPFDMMLQALADYRWIVKGLGPVAPWARRRLCTAYMKIKVQMNYCHRTLGWTEWEAWIGLRADEPDRLRDLRYSEWQSGGGDQSAPLADLRIDKKDVYRFWEGQPFDLELYEDDDAVRGNCGLCFVKDEADRARAAYADPDRLARWLLREKAFGKFTPDGAPTTADLAREGSIRAQMQTALECGEDPAKNIDKPHWMTWRRWENVLIQERKRHAGGALRPSCRCEAAEHLGDEDVLEGGDV